MENRLFGSENVVNRSITYSNISFIHISLIHSKADETDSMVKRSSAVILAIFGHFCKIEKAHIGAVSWTDTGSV